MLIKNGGPVAGFSKLDDEAQGPDFSKHGNEGQGPVAVSSKHGIEGYGPVAVSSECVMKYRDQWRNCIKKDYE
jgi:hypothetical protein